MTELVFEKNIIITMIQEILHCSIYYNKNAYSQSKEILWDLNPSIKSGSVNYL